MSSSWKDEIFAVEDAHFMGSMHEVCGDPGEPPSAAEMHLGSFLERMSAPGPKEGQALSDDMLDEASVRLKGALRDADVSLRQAAEGEVVQDG